jgi:cell wall-associated NlpC family hydrolase
MGGYMKLAWISFIVVMTFLAGYGVWRKLRAEDEVVASEQPQSYSASKASGGLTPGTRHKTGNRHNWFFKRKSPALPAYKGKLPRHLLDDSITAYGLKLIGTPYKPAGITCEEGFDCSGFIHHIFGRYGVALPHASALLIKEGTPIPLSEVSKGDLLIFTGPGRLDGKPGHVGVVITDKGQSPEFVHSSSVGGVKISKVEGTGYQKRFLQARRVL